MTDLRLATSYDPRRIPAQAAFRASKAKVLGYGGAVAGGKTRTACELAFDWMLEYPGILLPIFRQVHTHMLNTTRRTFMEQVMPPELLARKDLVRIKQSQGFDFIEFLWNGSQCHFVGLDNPGAVFGAEFGGAMFDEAQEIDLESVQFVNTRMRQRCRKCIAANLSHCDHIPRRMVFTFNPSFPGHWLHQVFIQGSDRTEFGHRKHEVILPDADSSIGAGEYFIASPRDNPFLPPNYIEENLAGLSKLQRQRLLEGRWIHISGNGFFDEEAVARLEEWAMDHPPFLTGEAVGDLTGTNDKDRPRVVERGNGRLQVFKAPVRWHVTRDGVEVPNHRYIIGVDTSSGASADYSGIQVLDVDEFEQVAEWQGKIDPDTLAEIAFLLGCVYNGALLAPEVTGGWGFAVVKRIQKLGQQWKGPDKAKPKLYTRPMLTRLANKYTDLLGFDTNVNTRSHMLSTLEAMIREDGVKVHGTRTVAELAAFAFPQVKPGMDYRPPRAQPGEHDDLVIPLAIAVTIAATRPRQVTRAPAREENIALAAAGY